MNKNVLEKKKATVEEIREGLKANKSAIVVSYQGFTVKDLSELRRKLAEKNASIAVYKNTMIKRALEAEGISSLDHLLEGPNALVYSAGETDALAILRKYSRMHEALKVKGGLISGTAVEGETLLELAKLPDGKNSLIAMFLSCLNAPVVKFAATIKSLAEKKESAGA